MMGNVLREGIVAMDAGLRRRQEKVKGAGWIAGEKMSHVQSYVPASLRHHQRKGVDRGGFSHVRDSRSLTQRI